METTLMKPLVRIAAVSLVMSFPGLGVAAAQIDPAPPTIPALEIETPTHSANTPTRRTTEGPLHERWAAMNRRVAEGNVDLIFIGDSITESWGGPGRDVWAEYYSDRNAVNLGISGDRTQHVLWRLDNGNIDGIRPKVAVIMIGTNNSNGTDNTAAEIADGVRAIVEKLRDRLPDTKILLLDIFPRGRQINNQRGKILQTNQILQKLDDGEHVFFHSIGYEFIEDDGSIKPEIMPDALHLTPRGYRIWADAIEDELVQLMGE
jgi:lysophospholipase L1-like esterase